MYTHVYIYIYIYIIYIHTCGPRSCCSRRHCRTWSTAACSPFCTSAHACVAVALVVCVIVVYRA